MTKAILPPPAKSISQLFKEWAVQKGSGYFKGKNLKDHLMVFEEESGLRIQPYLAHELITRLVRQNRSKAKPTKIKLVALFLRPSFARDSW